MPANLRERLQEFTPDLLAAGNRSGQWVSDALLQKEKTSNEPKRAELAMVTKDRRQAFAFTM
jgi:hypothetical protein